MCDGSASLDLRRTQVGCYVISMVDREPCGRPSRGVKSAWAGDVVSAQRSRPGGSASCRDGLESERRELNSKSGPACQSPRCPGVGSYILPVALSRPEPEPALQAHGHAGSIHLVAARSLRWSAGAIITVPHAREPRRGPSSPQCCSRGGRAGGARIPPGRGRSAPSRRRAATR